MNQFSLYINTDVDSKKAYPYFVDVQTNLLEMLNSRVVIPLAPSREQKALPKNLCPKVQINGDFFYLLTHQITTVRASFLKQKEGTLLLNREDIIAALDFLFSGI